MTGQNGPVRARTVANTAGTALTGAVNARASDAGGGIHRSRMQNMVSRYIINPPVDSAVTFSQHLHVTTVYGRILHEMYRSVCHVGSRLRITGLGVLLINGTYFSGMAYDSQRLSRQCNGATSSMVICSRRDLVSPICYASVTNIILIK